MQTSSMIKRSAVALALGALLVGPAVADPDHSGAWHSVAAKSSWSNSQFPKNFSLTINVQFSDNKIVYHSVNDTNKNAVANLDFTAPLDGTVAPLPNNARFNQVAVRMQGPNEMEILEMKDGDVVVGSFWTFSADGKTFVRRGVGKDAAGKSHEFEEYFTRQ